MKSRDLRHILLTTSLMIAAFVIPLTIEAHTGVSPTAPTPTANLPALVLPPELQSAVDQALQSRPFGMLEGEELAPTSAHVEDAWALVSVAARSSTPTENRYVGHGRSGGLVLASRSLDGSWQAALQATTAFDRLLQSAPQSIVSAEAKRLLSSGISAATASRSVVGYKLPWPAGVAWNWWASWHPSPSNDGHDFGTSARDRRLLASADGVVTYICRGTVSANVKVKHADGVILDYVHLDKNTLDIGIYEGARVRQGQVLGILKPGAWSDWPCGYTTQNDAAAHLHWIVPTDRTFTVDGWTIKYPDNFWQKNGDKKTPGYTSSSAMLSSNQPIDSGDLIVDELEGSFAPVGIFSSRACGYNGHTYWTYATDGSEGIGSENIAAWRPTIPTTGRYKLFVHIPQGCGTLPASAKSAGYQVRHADGTTMVTVDQTTTQAWVELGTFKFNAGTSGALQLTDLANDLYSSKQAIFFDAVQWLPEGASLPAPTPTPTPVPTPSSTAVPKTSAVLVLASIRSPTIMAGEPVQVDFTVRNTGATAIDTQMPHGGISSQATGGWVYDEAECFSNTDPQLNFAKQEGRLRVTLGFANGSASVPLNCGSGEAIYPWRWGLGQVLQPGETRTVSGYIRFRTPGTYQLKANLVHEWIRYYGMDGAGADLELGQLTVLSVDRTTVYLPSVVR